MNPLGIPDAQLALRVGARSVLVLAALAMLASPGVAAACECLNNTTAIDFDTSTGGTDGQFSERVTVNAPANQSRLALDADERAKRRGATVTHTWRWHWS